MTPPVESPGSIRSFEEANPHLSSEEALKAWEAKLVEYRGFLAESLGLADVTELHFPKGDRNAENSQPVLANQELHRIGVA